MAHPTVNAIFIAEWAQFWAQSKKLEHHHTEKVLVNRWPYVI
jgi:hypothetical protein